MLMASTESLTLDVIRRDDIRRTAAACAARRLQLGAIAGTCLGSSFGQSQDKRRMAHAQGLLLAVLLPEQAIRTCQCFYEFIVGTPFDFYEFIVAFYEFLMEDQQPPPKPLHLGDRSRVSAQQADRREPSLALSRNALVVVVAATVTA